MTQNNLRSGFAFLAVMLAFHGSLVTAVVEDFTVQEFEGTESRWPTFVKEKTTISISGRYEGRVSDRLRMAKLKLRLIPLRTAAFPKDLLAGRRLKVTGIMTRPGTRYVLEISRIVVGTDDITRLKNGLKKLKPEDFNAAYQLATEYEPIQQFYNDSKLAAEITAIRENTFARQRATAVKAQDSQQLLALIAVGQKLNIAPRTLTAISFPVSYTHLTLPTKA